MAQGTKCPVRNKIIAGWAHYDIIENFVDKYEKQDSGRHDCEHCPYDMPAQGLEMIDKTHLGFFSLSSADTLEKRLPIRFLYCQKSSIEGKARLSPRWKPPIV
jgi:hypothetical protein